MTVSPRIRRVTASAVTALGVGLGGLAAVAPAHASPTVNCSSSGAAGVYFSEVIWTTPGVVADVVDTSGLLLDRGGSVQCTWSNGLRTNLTLQGSDGNFVFYNYTSGKTWGANTRPNGYTAEFQSDANLVVRTSAGTAIWASNTHTYPNGILAFQSDGNLVIYPSDTNFTAKWATNTE